MLNNIEYDSEDYIVLDEEFFSEYKGDYRIVKFRTGFYALQKLMKSDSLNNHYNDEYVTVLVSPIQDKMVNDDLCLLSGNMIINEMFNSIKEADNSYKGSHWQLNLYLADKEGVDKFTEIITHEDGDTLVEQLNILYEYQREVNDYFLRYYPSCSNF
jgi:hypothetical protein